MNQVGGYSLTQVGASQQRIGPTTASTVPLSAGALQFVGGSSLQVGANAWSGSAFQLAGQNPRIGQTQLQLGAGMPQLNSGYWIYVPNGSGGGTVQMPAAAPLQQPPVNQVTVLQLPSNMAPQLQQFQPQPSTIFQPLQLPLGAQQLLPNMVMDTTVALNSICEC